MQHPLISFFTKRHLFTNMIVIGVFIGALMAWDRTGKEEMPDFSLHFLMIRTSYPGASPQDVEKLVTKELENELKGIDGIYELRSSSREAMSTIFVEFEPDYEDVDEGINEIRNAVQSVRLPAEIRNPPSVRVFKISKKAVIDVAVYNENIVNLTDKQRFRLQEVIRGLENRLFSLDPISEVSRGGYLTEELQIKLLPSRLRQYDITPVEVMSAISKHHIRKPAGNLSDSLDTRVSLVAELDTPEKLRDLVIRTGFDAPTIRLGQLADVHYGFIENTTLFRVNGRQGVYLRVYKSMSAGILEATKAVKKLVSEYNDVIAKEGFRSITLDDESRDVRNRLSIISYNGLIGFVLVIILLLVFLNHRSAIWVALGIPFTFALTMVVFPLIGFTINNVTLAAVIIVMGMIVDDAIVVAENVSRMRGSGYNWKEAAVEGTAQVFWPIVVSSVTTCLAFLPMIFFGGRFGQLVTYIPFVVFIMLGASLFESTFILPGHLAWSRKKRKLAEAAKRKQHWFDRLEGWYAARLVTVLRWRMAIILGFVGLLAFSGWLAVNHFSFVLFPREETTEFRVVGQTPEGTGRRETARRIEAIEDYIRQEIGYTVNGFRTRMGQTRRGKVAGQNIFRLRVELLDPQERTLPPSVKEDLERIRRQKDGGQKPEPNTEGNNNSANGKQEEQSGKKARKQFKEPSLRVVDNQSSSRVGRETGNEADTNRKQDKEGKETKPNRGKRSGRRSGQRETVEWWKKPLASRSIQARWQAKLKKLSGIEKLRIVTHRFGQSSGSAIEVEIQENNDERRQGAARMLATSLSNINGLTNIEVERPMFEDNYILSVNRVKVEMLGVNVDHIASVLRTLIEGSILYEVITGDEEMNVRLMLPKEDRSRLDRILQYKIADNARHYIPLNHLVSVRKVGLPASIERENHKREVEVYADLDKSGSITPLEVAEKLEKGIFREIMAKYPSTVLRFGGEIQDTREAGGDFLMAIVLALGLIFTVLVLQFNSSVRPLVIMSIIPFGIIGVALAFWLHGIEMIGFFTAIGTLGLIGVIINDSIVLLDRLDNYYDETTGSHFERIGKIASTRLKAIALTTLTTVAGVMPTAYGVAGYDSMLADMMLALSWGLVFGTSITLLFIPSIYSFVKGRELAREEAE